MTVISTVEIEKPAGGNKVDHKEQIARVELIIAQVKALAAESPAIKRILQGETTKSESGDPDSTLRTQYNLLERIAVFTQVYPELTPKDESFANWLINEWLL